MNLNVSGAGRTAGVASGGSLTADMCVPDSENDVASGVSGLAFQINVLTQADALPSPALLLQQDGTWNYLRTNISSSCLRLFTYIFIYINAQTLMDVSALGL